MTQTSKLQQLTFLNLAAPLINYENLATVFDGKPGAWINTCGILSQISDAEVRTNNSNGRQLRMRELIIIDENILTVKVTLWNKDLDKIKRQDQAVVFFERVRSKVNAGKVQLTFTELSSISFDIQHECLTELEIWWREQDLTDPVLTPGSPPQETTMAFAEMKCKMAEVN